MSVGRLAARVAPGLAFALALSLSACADDDVVPGPDDSAVVDDGMDAADDSGQCEYAETAMQPGDDTPWGTTVADDLAWLEQAQTGTWTWASSSSSLLIDDADTQLAAIATFVHEPDSMWLSEPVEGSAAADSCEATLMRVDGILTITNSDNQVIISVPITVARNDTTLSRWSATPVYEPTSQFSEAIHPTASFDAQRVHGEVTWLDGPRLQAAFDYEGVSAGAGGFTHVGAFEPDP